MIWCAHHKNGNFQLAHLTEYFMNHVLSLKSPPSLKSLLILQKIDIKNMCLRQQSDSQVYYFCNAVRTFWILSRKWQVDRGIPNVKKSLCSVQTKPYLFKLFPMKQYR